MMRKTERQRMKSREKVENIVEYSSSSSRKDG